MCANYLIQENRIVNLDDIKDIKDYIICGICYQVVTEDREPVECHHCHNQLFCATCIQSWTKQSSNCPYCHQVNAKFVEISPILLNMIRSIKYYCKNKERGCQNAFTMNELLKHECDCQFQNENELDEIKLTHCKLCNEHLEKSGSEAKNDPTFVHYCDLLEKQFCGEHKSIVIQITKDRIKNLEENQNIYDIFQCNICANLVRKPKTCQCCRKNFCQHCISNALIHKNICPSCYQQKPEFSNMSRNLQQLLYRFQITCKNLNKGCEEQISYENLEKHESLCEQCPNCFIRCPKCTETFDVQAKLVHKCPEPIKTNQVQQDLAYANSNYQMEDSFNRVNNNNVYDHSGRQTYCQRVRENCYSACGNVNWIVIILFMILDFIVQNALIALYALYFIYESFVNKPCKNAFIAFIVLYGLGTFLPHLISILKTSFRTYQQTNHKAPVLILSIFQMHFLYSIFVMGPPPSDNLVFKNTFCIRSVIQIALQITLITILAINQVDTLIKALTIGVSSFEILFNITYSIVINI